jgi:hypothetical protein
MSICVSGTKLANSDKEWMYLIFFANFGLIKLKKILNNLLYIIKKIKINTIKY